MKKQILVIFALFSLHTFSANQNTAQKKLNDRLQQFFNIAEEATKEMNGSLFITKDLQLCVNNRSNQKQECLTAHEIYRILYLQAQKTNSLEKVPTFKDFCNFFSEAQDAQLSITNTKGNPTIKGTAIIGNKKINITFEVTDK